MHRLHLDFVRAETPATEQLALLAEEAAELGQAALKLRRAIDGTSPTPVTTERALANLLEEVADVCLILHVLQIDINSPEHNAAKASKLRRWVGRIKEKQERS